MIRYAFKRFIMGGGVNTSLLPLIPKELNPSSFSRFHLISFYDVSYKVISKFLASRLKNFLSQLILVNQGGFVLGRQIFDNIILLQEAIDSSWKIGDQGMVIKLDMKNSFDKVKHNFMLKVLKKLGFVTTFT